MASTAAKPRPLETFPTELLLRIFSFAANNFDPKQEPSINDGNSSPWSKDLRVKKRIVRVCKKWRGVALPELYRRVYLRRADQLCAFVKVLEESAAGKEEGGGYGGWVQHIHGWFYVAPNWETVYAQSAERLLSLCSSSSSFLWKTSWVGSGAGRYSEGPSSDESSTIRLICPPNLQKPIFQSTLSSLRTLLFSLDSLSTLPEQSSYALLSTVPFDNLEDLTCEARNSSAIWSLDFVSWCFRMPYLRSLTINIHRKTPMRELKGRELASILRVLEHHGQRLTSLVLDTLSVLQNAGKNVKDILLLCPILESFRCSDRVFSAIDALDTPFLPLRKLELRVLSHDSYNPRVAPPEEEGLEAFMSMSRNRDIFPRLESVAVYHHSFPSFPLEQALHGVERQIFFEYFLSWTRKFRETGGIVLLNAKGEPMISADHERWNGWAEHEYDDEEDEDDELSGYAYSEDGSEAYSDEISEDSLQEDESDDDAEMEEK